MCYKRIVNHKAVRCQPAALAEEARGTGRPAVTGCSVFSKTCPRICAYRGLVRNESGASVSFWRQQIGHSNGGIKSDFKAHLEKLVETGAKSAKFTV